MKKQILTFLSAGLLLLSTACANTTKGTAEGENEANNESIKKPLVVKPQKKNGNFYIMNNKQETQLSEGLYAQFKTNKGEILVRLEHEKTPMTVANFVGLAEGKIENKKFPLGHAYYDGLKFHRVIADFMIQGGDPEGSGMGGPGYNFEDEIVADLKHDAPGVLSMANAGPATNGSQFFITHVATPWLDGKHTVFGKVVNGMDIVNAIKQNDVMENVAIIRVGKSAENFNPKEVFEKEKSQIQEKIAKADAERKQKEAEALASLTKNAQKTESGLAYVVKKKGSGATAKAGQKITCHYVLTLADGRKIDSSYDRNQPFEFTVGVGQVIRGWDEGMMLLNPGSEATLIIPSDLGYGPQGAGNGVIPPNATLIFEVVILKID
jgi:peptidyl-prolyl cis-trans isomerase A (cyclophilin A)